MAFETTSNRMPPYAGGSSTPQFPFTFPLSSARPEAKDDLKVLLETAAGDAFYLVRGVDHQVNINSNASTGGAVVLLDNDQAWLDTNGYLAGGYRLHLFRELAVVQPTSIKNLGEFHPEIHERVFDRQAMISQQLNEKVGRALTLAPQILPGEFNPAMPAALVGAANRTFVTNDTGTGFKLGPTESDLQAAVDAAGEAAISASSAAMSANLADASADAAAVSETNADGYADSALASADSAAESELEAEAAKDDAVDAAQDAAASASAAAASAATAAAAALPKVEGSRSSPQVIVPATGVVFDNATPSREHIHFVVSNGGEKTISMNPQINNATGGASAIGKKITLRGRSNTDFLVIEDGRGLSLNGPINLYTNASLTLEWDGADWVEFSRSER